MWEHNPAGKLSAREANRNEEYASVRGVEIRAEYRETNKSYNGKRKSKSIDFVNISCLYQLIYDRESKKLYRDKDTEEHRGATLGSGNVLCKVNNARGENVHTKRLTEVHTNEVSEGTITERLDDLLWREASLFCGSLYSFLNEDGAKDNGESKEDSEADAYDKIEGHNIDLAVLIGVDNERRKERAYSGAGGGNNETEDVCAIALLAYSADLRGHTAVGHVDHRRNGVVEEIGCRAVDKLEGLALIAQREENKSKSYY